MPKLAFRKKNVSSEPSDTTAENTKKNKRKGPWKKRVIAIVVVCAVVAGVGVYFVSGRQNSVSAADTTYTTANVERRDITAEITGSGTLEAANSYSVSTLLEGTILSANFEEGDIVEEGTVLYTIDSSDASSSLEKSQISLTQAQRSYNNKLKDRDDLNLTSDIAGRVLTMDLEVGDDISAGQTIATVQDSETMTLTVPFPADDAAGFYIGQAATVTLDGSFETLYGTVSEIGVSNTVLSGNVIVRDITIDVSNPGGLSTTQSATGEINGVGSASSATFVYNEEGTITAKTGGTIAKINIAKGDWVTKNQIVVVLSSDTLDDEIQSASESVRNAELSLESQTDQLDDYTITSPIAGTVIDKNYKAGETTESNQVLCTIYDLTYLEMTLSVDELDVSNIAVGQDVSITAEAVENKTYAGVVTKVSVAGTTSNGVTTYPVTIRIDETEGLLPGMNVDASIVLESASDVLAIPSAALMRGNTVLVTADSPSAANGVAMQANPGMGTGGTETGERGSGSATTEESASTDDSAIQPTGNQQAGTEDAGNPASGGAQAAQYVTVQVEVGASDDTYTEIISGLQEGDVVAYIPTTSSSSTTDTFMMGGGMQMGGGMSGGGMSGGGMSGGNMGGGMPGGF